MLPLTLSSLDNLHSLTYNLQRGGSIVDLTIQGKKIFYADPVRRNNFSTTMREGTWMFPFLGTLDSSTQKEEGYHLPRHGFSRDMAWSEIANQRGSASRGLKSSPETQQQFPGGRSLQQDRSLREGACDARLTIQNDGRESFKCSPGFHTYFFVPDKQKSEIILGDALNLTDEEKKMRLSGDDTIKVDNPGVCEIFLPGGGGQIRLSVDKIFSKIWFRTEPGKDFVCIEPVVCNTEDRDASALMLGAKESVSLGFAIEALEATK